MRRSTDREIMIEAFGAPADPDANVALELILDALRADAVALPDGDETIRLACKLRALCSFVEKYLTVSWSNDASESETPVQPTTPGTSKTQSPPSLVCLTTPKDKQH